MIKIYSDRKYVPHGIPHVVMLYPFWGKNPEDPADPVSGRFDKYLAVGSTYFEVASLQDSDVAILPCAWERIVGNHEAIARARELFAEARRARKKTVIFFFSDSDEQVAEQDVVVFRTSLYRSSGKPNEFPLPAWSEDFIEKYLGSKFPLREKTMRPVVGFCGYVAFPWRSWKHDIRVLVERLVGLHKASSGPLSVHAKPGHSLRGELIRRLRKHVLLKTNVIVREDFFGGVISPDGSQDTSLKEKLRKDFLENLVNSDYALCTRGVGNYSYRLYEALCCGRIPVFVDTDCVLPYESEIDWRKLCVWVDMHEAHLTARKVLKFHRSLSGKEFIERQKECRRVWEEYLSPQGFFKHFHEHFKGLL